MSTSPHDAPRDDEPGPAPGPEPVDPVTAEQVRFARRWSDLDRPLRIALVVAVAPLFAVLPYLLRQTGLGDLWAIVLGVVLAAIVFVAAAGLSFKLTATKTRRDRPPPTEA